MKNYIISCLLFIAPSLAMDADDDALIKICALGDKQERIGAELPKKMALSCELIKNGLELYEVRTFFVKPQYALVPLWKMLKPCMQWVDDSLDADPKKMIKELVKTPQDLASVLRASNYFGHRKLFEHCVAEWADRDYALEKFCKFPQEIEGAIAREILIKHKLTNTLLSFALKKKIVVIKVFNSINKEDVWSCALGKGNRVAAGRSDGTIHYWIKVNTRWRRHAIYKAHGNNCAVGQVQFIDGDQKLISSGDGRGVRIWNVATGKRIGGFGDAECNGFFFSYNEARRLLAIGTKEDRINVYSLSENNEEELKIQCEGHNGEIRCLAFNPSGDLLASVGEDRMLAVWDLTTGLRIHAFDLPCWAFSIKFSHSGKFIAVGLDDGTVLIYDFERLALCEQENNAHDNRIWSCCFSEDDSLLFTAAIDRKIKVWALPGLECLKVIEEDKMSPILFMDQNLSRNQLLVGFNNGQLGLASLAPLLKEIKDQRNYVKHGLKMPRAQFLVRAFHATQEQPLECTGENGKIFNSLSREFKAQLIENLYLRVPKELTLIQQARPPRKWAPRKKK
jgi:hypothetical protein